MSFVILICAAAATAGLASCRTVDHTVLPRIKEIPPVEVAAAAAPAPAASAVDVAPTEPPVQAQRPEQPAAPTVAVAAASPPAPAPKEHPNAESQRSAALPRAIYFGRDAYKVDASYRPALEAHARKLNGSPSLRLEIQAFADTRGPREYNLALSKKRAETVMKALIAMGVPRRQLRITNHGESRRVAERSSGKATPADRRVELVYR